MSTENKLYYFINQVANTLKNSKSIMIVFSDDGDGIASAAIASYLAEKLNNEYTLVCLDKVIPEALNLIFNEEYDIYFFLDLGGPLHIFIPDKMINQVIIIDHHEEVITPPINLLYINPTVLKLGGEFATTSTILYYIYKKCFGQEKEIVWMPLISIGEVEGEFKGLNWKVFVEAEMLGVGKRVVKKGKMTFHICIDNYDREIKMLYKDITLISSVGYYSDGPLKVVEALLFKDLDMIREDVYKYKLLRQNAYKNGIEILEKERLFQLKRVQWFMDIGIFNSMGTRVFDSFTSFVRFQGRLLSKNKYILGLMRRKRKIPGLGDLKNDWTNIAIRVPKYLETLILGGQAQPVSALAEAVSHQVGGLGYGYKILGGAIIPSKSENTFIKTFDELALEGVI